MPVFVRTYAGNVIRPEHCRRTIHMVLGDGRAREGGGIRKDVAKIYAGEVHYLVASVG